MRFEAPTRGHPFATLLGVTSFRTSWADFWHDALTRRLITVPRLTPSHEVPRTNVFRSLLVRLSWRFWMQILTPGGRYFFIATLLFGFYGLVSFEVQAFVPLAYAVAVWSLALVLTIVEKPRVSLVAHHASRGAAGETVPVEIEVTGNGRRIGGESAVIPHRLPVEIGVVPGSGAPLPPLRAGAVARARFLLTPEKRGVYALRGFRVVSDFPFGLLNTARLFQKHDVLTVTPKFDPLERLDLPLGHRYQAGGQNFSTTRGESLEYIGNRDYREGDAVRDIDWRATARLSRPIVREYREEWFQRAALVLDTHLTQNTLSRAQVQAQLSAQESNFERAVSLGAACAEFLNRSDFLIEKLVVGTQIHDLRSGEGTASLDQILDILASAMPSSQASWNRVAAVLSESSEKITSIMCVFLDWDEARRAFATHLSEDGAAVKIVIVRDEPPSLDPTNSWPGEIAVLGAAEFQSGVRSL